MKNTSTEIIRKLKTKFTLLAISSLFLLLTVIVIGMNIINYSSVIGEADEILRILSQNRGTFPGFSEVAPDKNEPVFEDKWLTGEKSPSKNAPLPPHLSPELPYESRYFSVLLDEEGNIVAIDTSRIVSINSSTAEKYATEVYFGSKDRGFISIFRFMQAVDENGFTRITFLNCERQLDTFSAFVSISISISLAGLLIVSLIIIILSGKIIRPISESYDKQKRFITDAGHEIKTPLTIIGANADILELEIGENDCITDIKQQTKRLSELTRDLICLARMEEGEASMQTIDFPLSEVVKDSAESFKSLFTSQNKRLDVDIRPMLSLVGNDRAIGQLVTILLDNALKYSAPNGVVSLSLVSQGKNAVLTVVNPTDLPVDPKELDKIFNRFYRTDPSRNSNTGGHGIGLSIAKAIVSSHKGKIFATADDPHIFKLTVILPFN